MGAADRPFNSLFAPPAVETIRRADGCILLRSPQELADHGRCLGDWLEYWADAAPDRPFLLERAPDGNWEGVTYRETVRQVYAIATWLMENGCSAERPTAILGDNGVRHALLALASMHVGIPVASLSSAYSLVSTDFGKLKSIVAQITPGVLYVPDTARYGAALAALRGLHDARIVADQNQIAATDLTQWDDLVRITDRETVQRAFAVVGPDTVAKLLFTSGSTGIPKAVVTTQRMLLVNQQQMRQVWPFLEDHVPVLVDWLPWSHTFGGNHNFNLVLRSGGTLYIDAGRPVAQKFDQTLANLREVAPTLYFNVPRGFDMLLPALQRDTALRELFFSRLQLLFYAAAALPAHLWEALRELGTQVPRRPVPIVTAWGSTETAPLAASCHFQAASPGVIGLPVPGVELKLVPRGPNFEVRVKGPNVTPGYWRRPDLTASAFDEESYYLIGDAVRPAEPDRFDLGLIFDGRVSEDFKLSSGTWVNTGAVRLGAIAAFAPLVQDVVVTGHNRDSLGLLLFPNLPACRELCGLAQNAPVAEVLSHPSLREKIRAGLRELRSKGTGSSTYPSRALLLAEPASIDAGEITDKGYINQRTVLERRQALVELLYSEISSGDRIELGGPELSDPVRA